MYEAALGFQPVKAPQSCYVAVNHKGKTFHLFNAARYPLGRMARQISVFIRGKHKPTYDPTKSGEDGDMCVVVNAKRQWTGGNRKDNKKYYKHTGYPGGLKVKTMREMLNKDAPSVVYLTVKGMLPKNKTRRKLLRQKLIVHEGPYHQFFNQKLPQFTESPPLDINKLIGLDLEDVKANPQDYTITYEENPNDPLEALKDVKRELGDQMVIPHHLQKPRMINPKANLRISKANNLKIKKLRKL